MKNFFIVLSACFVYSSAVTAQSFHFGLKAGADLHKIEGQAFKDEFRLGYHAGAFAEIGVPGKLGLQPEIYFSQINTRTQSSAAAIYGFNGITKIKLSYLNIPLLLSYPLTRMLSIQAGPQFGILIDKDKNLSQNGKDAFENGDVGITGGLQLNFLKLRVYGRYVIGVSNVNGVGADEWNTQTIHLGIGYRIF